MKTALSSQLSGLRRVWPAAGLFVLFASLLVTARVPAEPAATAPPAAVTLLYTNDIHDTLKASRGGVGGLAYVSGFINKVRQTRKGVVVLDAGDVCEKGDMLGIVTRGEATYRAMAAVGYDAGAPGNHDTGPYGLQGLARSIEVSRFPIVAANIVYEDTGEPVFPPTREVNADGVRVGIIGVANGGAGTLGERKVRILTGKALGERIRALALEIRPKVDLIVVVAHHSSAACKELALAAPEVQVWVSGHSHEVIREPLRAPNNNALIVQAGQYARFVGELNLTLDREAKTITPAEGRLVEMDHTQIAPDTGLAERIAQWNRETCPEAAEVVAQAPEHLAAGTKSRPGPLGLWLAEAIRFKAEADVALFREDLLRHGLSAGPVAVDDLYRLVVNGNRRQVSTATLTGADLAALLERLHAQGRSLATAGLPQGDPAATAQYRVAMPRGLIPPPAPDAKAPGFQHADYTVADAAVAYARHAKVIAAPMRGE